MNFQADHGFSISFSRTSPAADALVPAYTPMWYATRVMSTSANHWWDGGVPPARKSGRSAANAVVNAAAGVARRLNAVRSSALS